MVSGFLIGLVKVYQVVISSWTLPSCRYMPSCSAYAIEALRVHGALRGSWMAAKRIGRCHPWGGCGYDPVPPAKRERGEAMRVNSEKTAAR